MMKYDKMKMTKIWALVGAVMLVGGLTALSSCASEDPIEVQVDDTRYYFEPKPERTDDEALLRRAFYDRYDIHLIFNDTLRHDSICLDFNGETHYFTELIDMYYSVGNYSTGSTTNTYRLLTTMEQKYKATKYLETEIQPHFNERMRPFSWLLVNDISEKSSSSSKPTSPYAITGERCIAIALSTYFKLTPARVPTFTQQVLNIIAVKMAKNNSKALQRFYDFSNSYYGVQFAESDISNDENLQILREAGFFSKGKNMVNVQANGIYPSNDVDLGDYVRLTIGNTREQVKKQYADYPLIIKKDSVIRELLEERGFVYEPEKPAETVTDLFYNK